MLPLLLLREGSLTLLDGRQLEREGDQAEDHGHGQDAPPQAHAQALQARLPGRCAQWACALVSCLWACIKLSRLWGTAGTQAKPREVTGAAQ